MNKISERATGNPSGEGQRSAGQPAVRRRRPHPARRARRVVGAAGVSGMLLMTGYMTLNAAQSASAGPSSTATATPAQRAATVKSSTVAVAAAKPSTTPITVSKSS